MFRAIELQVELQLRFFLVASDVATKNHTSESLDCFVIRANSELQLRYDDVILLIHKLMLSPRHTLNI
jgi:hypothetical protein